MNSKPMKLTRKRAKEFSSIHWREKVKNKGKNLSLIKLKELGLNKLLANCGYCEKYAYTSSKTLESCAKCPIRPKVKDYDDFNGIGCLQECHSYRKWLSNSTSENAQGVLTLIDKS